MSNILDGARNLIPERFGIKAFLNKNPAVFLLLFVYIVFIPLFLSYDRVWVLPEEFYFKTVVLTHGPALQLNDLKLGLNCMGFENAPRLSRPLSSYFEILDTKFRCWLWHYVLPHPSLSLTWIFSFIGTPLLLYRLLRYWKVSVNTAMAMTAFYLMTPEVMSCAVMLFHPGKPMAHFFMVFCLYQASQLQKGFLDQDKPIPVIDYIYFWLLSALSFYWDETMWVILPALWVLFPRVIAGKKVYLWAWLSLPFVTVFFYFKAIPFLMVLAGYDYADLLKFKASFPVLSNFPLSFLKNLPGNAKSLVVDTMGIMVPDVFKASSWIKICFGAALAAWGVVGFYLWKAKWRWDGLVLFLGGLILFFNYLITIIATGGVWGPYYYGTFWSVFFVIGLGLWIQRSSISRFVLTVCFFPIFLSMFYCFSAINTVYKKYHYYPYNPRGISQYFAGQKSFFDPDQTPRFSGDEIKRHIQSYWLASKQNLPFNKPSPLPRELYWLVLEMQPEELYAIYSIRSTDAYIPAFVFNPDFAKTYSDRGDFYANHNDLTQAMSDYNKALEIKPDYVPAYSNRGALYEKQGAFTQAMSDYNKAIEINPDYARAHSNRGALYEKQRAFTQAMSDYNKAIELDPGADTYNDRGNDYCEQGQYTQAISDYDKALEINPKYYVAYQNRAISYYYLKEYVKAWADVYKARELGAPIDPEFMRALKKASGRG